MILLYSCFNTLFQGLKQEFRNLYIVCVFGVENVYQISGMVYFSKERSHVFLQGSFPLNQELVL